MKTSLCPIHLLRDVTCKTAKEMQSLMKLPKVLLKFVSKTFPKQSMANVLQNSVLKNFANFRGKHLCWGLFLIKLQRYTLFYGTPPVANSDLLKVTVLKYFMEGTTISSVRRVPCTRPFTSKRTAEI